MDVELVTEGETHALSSGSDLIAFRVVQEALTNVMKHAGPSHARVLLRWLDDALEIDVADDGRGPTPATPGGHGLIGMRERVDAARWLVDDRAAPGRWLRRARAASDRGRRAMSDLGAPIQVLIADDQALMRGGFRMILDAEPDIEVIGEAIDGADAVRGFERLRPDVVVMDVRMPTMDGIEATRRITAADARRQDPDAHDLRPRRICLRGAAGRRERLPAEGSPARGARAGRPRRGGGDALLAPDRHPAAHRGVRPPPRGARAATGLDELTDREREVLVLMARGLSNGEIAASLFVAETTVKTHVGRVLHKLGLRDRAQAVVLAYESGLVQPGA